MCVLRRMDAVLEPTKQAVIGMKASLDKAGIANQDQALRHADRRACRFSRRGAHAVVLQIPILTRDVTRFRAYFPTVKLMSPE